MPMRWECWNCVLSYFDFHGRLVCDHGMSADLCLTAVKILCSVCQSAAIQKDIIGMWTSSDVMRHYLHSIVIVY